MGSAPGDARRERLDGLALSLILGCCLIWGLNQVVMKITLPVIPPLMQGALRSLLAALLVGLWARHRRIALWHADGANGPGLIAGLMFAAEFCLIYWGLQHTSASRAVVFLYLAPFVVALGMPLIAANERLRGVQVLGLLLAFAGLAWVFRDGFKAEGPAASRQSLGDLLTLGGAIFWGLTTLLVRATRLSSAAPERTLFLQLAVSAPVMLIASWAAGEAAPQWTPLAIGSLFYQAVLIASVSYLTWFWLLRHYPATRVAAFTFLTPLMGSIAGVVLLGEPMSSALAIGLLGVAIGLWLVNRR